MKADQDQDDTRLDIDFDEELPAPKVFDPAEAVGATAPLGFFDPLGYCKKGDLMEFRKLRAAELKHGRVAMLASVGLVAQHFLRLPGFERAKTSFSSQVDVIFQVPGIFWFCSFTVVLFFLELSFWAQQDDREPGDFGDPLGLRMYDTEMRNRELNNGRFAMFATAGILAAQTATGKDAVQQFGF